MPGVREKNLRRPDSGTEDFGGFNEMSDTNLPNVLKDILLTGLVTRRDERLDDELDSATLTRRLRDRELQLRYDSTELDTLYDSNGRW